MMWPPPGWSVNGLFTETDGIMGWVLAGGESDDGRALLMQFLMKKLTESGCKAVACAADADGSSC